MTFSAGWAEFTLGAAILGGAVYLTAEPPEPEPELVPVAQVEALEDALQEQQVLIETIASTQVEEAERTRGLLLYIEDVDAEIKNLK